jgi:anti-sigma regulatory factor (Ser/Thr protein kinase)
MRAAGADPEPLRPSDLADPDPGDLDSLAERGRGLYLIHRLMDAVGRS